jgi:predicted porin
MKKSLLALAAMGAFAGAAQAQSSVTVYGTLDAAVRVNDTGATAVNGKTTNMAGGTTVTDRIGFRGVEDLGGGRTAFFQLETAISFLDNNPGTSTGQSASPAAQPGNWLGNRRPSFVGLSDKALGKLEAGSLYSPGFRFTGFGAVMGTNVFGTNLSQGMVTNSTADAASTSATTTTTADYKMVSNAVAYTTPTIAGANLELFASTKDTAASGYGGITGAMLNYTLGKLTAQAYIQKIQATSTAGTANGDTKASSAGLGVGYDFGVVNTRLSYQTNDPSDKIANNTITVTKLSVSAPVTKVISLYAGYALLKEQAGGSLYSSSATVAGDAKVMNVGATYALSKRTSLYADYASLSQDNNSRFSLTSAVQASTQSSTVGLKPSQIAIGMRHTF